MLPSTIETQLKAIFDKDAQADCIAIVWHERDVLDYCGQVNGIDVRVVYCVSELALREQLVQHSSQEGAQGCLVLLSAFDEAHLAKDVIARIWKNEPQRISPWKTLQQIIRVREFDPRLVKQSGKWMAESLASKHTAYQNVISFGEVLDKEKAWHALAIGYLGFNEPVQNIDSFFRWSLSPGVAEKYQALLQEISDNLNQWFDVVSPSNALTLEAIAETGQIQNVLPIALACSLIYQPNASQTCGIEPSEFFASQGRFVERYLDGKNISAQALKTLGDEGTRVVKAISKGSDSNILDRVGGITEQILASLNLNVLCEGSDILPYGYQLRLNKLAGNLEASIADKSKLVVAEKSLTFVRKHELAKLGKNTEQLNKATMALRLLRWLHRPELAASEQTKSIEGHLQEYIDHGGFVDWARSQIWSGDINENLSAVYHTISERVRSVCSAKNSAFTSFLPALARGDTLPAYYVYVENVLEQMLAPIAEHTPVLLLVLDGMSQAVYREVTEDLLAHDWVELAQDKHILENPQNQCVVTAFPTRTEVSRCSLLSGALTVGNDQVEKRNFSAKPVLKKIASSKYPPVLFHKKDIQQVGSGALDSDVRAKIAGKQHRILGVVINAIDDQLKSSSQVTVNWNLNSIKLLKQTLEAARESGRVVIITSDHGHVLDHDSMYRQLEGANGESGERYHCEMASSTEMEVIVEGKRVLTKDNQVVMPWSEQVRYTKSKSLGYHGGATLQELTIPLGVFVSAIDTPTLEGWQETIRYVPDWWDFETQLDLLNASKISGTTKKTEADKKPARKPPKAKQLAAEKMDDLFSVDDEVQEPVSNEFNLGGELVASTVFAQQIKSVGRTQISSEQIILFVNLLESGKGKVMDTTVCKELNIPRIRLRGFLANIQKIFNVEGYAIVSVDRESQTIQLNIPDLRTQFEL